MADGGDRTDGRTGEARGLDAMLRDLAALEDLARDWGERERSAAEARVAAVDALNAEAFRRLIRALRDVPEAGAALKRAVADEVVYAVLRRHGILKPSLAERVEAALATIRPTLASHGGDVELVSVAGARAELRFLGACDGCPASMLTFFAGVKKAIQDHVPEITEVKQVAGLGSGGGAAHVVSPFADPEGGWTEAMEAAALADGETRFLERHGRALILSRFGGRLTCFENACAHMGRSMERGLLADGVLTCPHHGFAYALETGECLTAPEVQLQPHAVRERGGRIEVKLGA